MAEPSGPASSSISVCFSTVLCFPVIKIMLCSSRAVETESNSVHRMTSLAPSLAWVSLAKNAWRRAGIILKKHTQTPVFARAKQSWV